MTSPLQGKSAPPTVLSRFREGGLSEFGIDNQEEGLPEENGHRLPIDSPESPVIFPPERRYCRRANRLFFLEEDEMFTSAANQFSGDGQAYNPGPADENIGAPAPHAILLPLSSNPLSEAAPASAGF